MAEVVEGSGWGRELPVEVLEMVLSQLPLSHLLSVAATVCQHWAAIIRNPAFLPWKKLYHQAKAAPASLTSSFLLSRHHAMKKVSAGKLVSSLCDRHDVNSLPSCLVSIIRLMGSVHRTPCQDPTPTFLSHHPLYPTAMATLQHMDSALLPGPHNIWHIATTIIFLCGDVWQVETVLELLLHCGSSFTSCDVVEAFYCLATFLFHCTRKLNLSTRYHYIVYYAMYLYENSWAGALSQNPGSLQKKHTGQQSMTQFLAPALDSPRHTHEQMRIINHDIRPDDVVKIVAFAGTGKTTTLLQFCKQRPHQRFLLVVYNKSVQEHCTRHFPPNTTIRTAHSLAYASVGRRFGAIKKLDNNINASHIASFLETKKDSGNRYRRAALVKNTVEQFLNSADDTLTLRHVPETDRKKTRLDDDFRLRILLPDAESVWNEMKKCRHSQQLSMTQDGQLKLWQLNKPKLGGYDIIMVDEAQDMNAAMFDIFLNQPCAKVIVGDPYQQIYSFRGAVNALAQVPASHTFHLTQSFRFGPELGYMAHCVLEGLLGVQSQTLVGGRCRDTVTCAPDPARYLITQGGHDRIPRQENREGGPPNASDQPEQAAQNTERATKEMKGEDGSSESRLKRMRTSEWGRRGRGVKRAYVARTNLELYKTALSFCKNKNFDAASMVFAGGMDKYGFNTVMDIYKLSQVQAGFGTPETLGIENKLIAKFSSVGSLKKFAENLDDLELWNKIMMYEFSGAQTPSDITKLKKRCGGKDCGQAEITFTTIHKAKGLEWDWVILLDDLIPNGILESASADDIGDEHNLLYVGITRAKRFLSLNSAALYAFTKAGEKLETLVPRECVAEGTRCLQCGSASVTSISHPLLTQVVPLRLSFHGDSFPGGHLCHTCSSFSSFVPPITRRHPPTRHRLFPDASRVARQMLIEGKPCEEVENTSAYSAMERGWHNYALKESGAHLAQVLNLQVLFDEPALLVGQLEEEVDGDFFVREFIQID